MFSAKNGKVFVFLVKLYKRVFHPNIFSKKWKSVFLVKLYKRVFHPNVFSHMLIFLSLWGWDWSPTGHQLVTFPYFMFGDWSHCMMHYVSVVLLQTDSAGGNCLFAAIKASMNVHHSNSKDAPYYPMRYFRRQVVAWMIKHHQLVVANKGVALMANYGLEEENNQFKRPLSYKQYIWHVLQCCFWGMRSSFMPLAACGTYGSQF